MFSFIEAKNMFSWEDLSYHVNDTGISQITGYNHDDQTSEGSGKSSILNVLCWTLYGKIPKDAKTDDVIREGAKSCIGIVTLDNHKQIMRSRKPNDVKITDVDGNVIKGKDAKETQELINQEIGLDFEAFCQTVYFAQNYPKKFITSSETDKVRILSDILDLGIFDRARKEAVEKEKQYEHTKTEMTSQLTSLQTDKKVIDTKMEMLVRVIETFEGDKQRKLAEFETSLKELEDDLKQLSELNVDTSSLEEHLEQAIQMQQVLSDKEKELSVGINKAEYQLKDQERIKRDSLKNIDNIEFLQQQLKKFEGEVGCPTCGAALTEEKKQEVCKDIDILNKKLNDAIKERDMLIAESSLYDKTQDPAALKKVLLEVQTDRKVIANRVFDLTQEREETQKIDIAITHMRQEQERLTSERKRLEAEEKTAELAELESLSKAELVLVKDLNKLEEKYNEIKELADKYTVLKDGFKRVKTYVFREFLQELSHKTTTLLSDFFEVPVILKFTNEKDGEVNKIQTIVTMDGVERPLGLYSGGQYRRLCLAVDLALADIISRRSNKAIGFRIFDEPFKDLSETSMEKIVNVLKNLGGSTIIIEHNSIVKSIIDTTFHVELKEGISRAVPSV